MLPEDLNINYLDIDKMKQFKARRNVPLQCGTCDK